MKSHGIHAQSRVCEIESKHACSASSSPSPSPALLLLILNLLNVVLRYLFVILRKPVEDIIAHISLHRDLLPSARRLRHRTPSCELLPELFRHFLQIQSELLQPANFCHVFPLVALYAFYVDFRTGALLTLASLGCFGFCCFLLRVPLCSFLRIDG